MLGLSPLTASPLGDDAPESEGEGADALSASSIVTGAPVVASADLSAQHALTASSIVTGAPTLGEPTASVVDALSANGIVTGRPVITGEIGTPGSIDAYARALQAAGLDNATSPRFQFSPDGTKYFVKPDGDGVGRPPQRYDLTTPWDVATGTLVNANGFNITTTNIIQDFQLSDDGLYIAFLMWANSDGKSAIHLYSLAQAFVTNYTGTSSSAGSDDGYTFVRSFIIDQGYRRIKAFRHFDGRLYTVDAPLTQNSTLQRRSVTNALFSSLGGYRNAAVLASTLTTTVTGYSIAFLSLDGSSRIYHSNASYDPLTLAQLEVSGQTLGFNLRYQLKPDGIGIVVPQLAEIDTDASVLIEQEGAYGASTLLTGAPLLGAGDLDQHHNTEAQSIVAVPVVDSADLVQDHGFIGAGIATGAPEFEAPLAQGHIFFPSQIETGSPVVDAVGTVLDTALTVDFIATGAAEVNSAALAQLHAVNADSIATGLPVLQSPTARENQDLAAPSMELGDPIVGSSALTQDHRVSSDPLATGLPAVQLLTISQDHVLLPSSVITAVPSTGNARLFLGTLVIADPVLTDAPVVGAATAFQDHQFNFAPIVTGAPSVAPATMAEAETFGTGPIVTGQPIVSSSAILQDHNLLCDAVTTGSPSVGDTGLAQQHNFGPDAIAAAAPVVSQLVLILDTEVGFSAISTGQPVIGSAIITQAHDLAGEPVETGQPVVSAATMAEDETFRADPILLGDTEVASAAISQNHVINAAALFAGQADIGPAIVVQVHTLIAANMATAPAVVSSAQLDVLAAADGIEAGQPIVGASTISQAHDLSAQAIETAPPEPASAQAVVAFAILANGILTGTPIVADTLINPSQRRAVSFSDASNNFAVVTDDKNYCILSANTPNRVIVAKSNEAA